MKKPFMSVILGAVLILFSSFATYMMHSTAIGFTPSLEASFQTPSEKATPSSEAQSKEKKDPPLNIVLLYADDWSFTTLGAMGNEFVKTPHLDKMAQDGMLFSHNCVTSSICMISRATLYTGQYASKHKTLYAYKNNTFFENGAWDYTLYPLLMKAGYEVGFFGKWHHLNIPKSMPPTFSKYEFYSGSHMMKWRNEIVHVTALNERHGLAFLRERPVDKPFAMTISFFATHAEDGTPEQYVPMNSSMSWYANETVPRFKTHTEEHWQKMPYFFTDKNFGRGRYNKRYNPEDKYQLMMKNTYRMASEVDAACGRIIAELEAQGVLNNTLVIFTTDNGNFHGQHGLAEKWYAYEEALRVPLIVMDPRMPKEARGTKNDEFTLNIDLAPTILSAAQVEVPDRMQGRDMSQLYLDPQRASDSWRKEFMYEWWGEEQYLPNNFALVRKDIKYINWDQFDYEQVFDMANDPFEENDMVNTTSPETMKALRTRMAELQALAASGASL